MEDIKTKEDIQHLVETFYSSALIDPVLGPTFNAAHFVLKTHIPIMVSFWETILFDVVTYKGNPMLKHLALNKTVTLHPVHFERWIEIWTKVLSSNFKGPLADKALTRAQSIGQLMEYKIRLQADQ